MRDAEQSVEDVAERRHAVQVVEYDDGGHRAAGSDVTGDVRGALVGDAVEILA